MKTKTKDTFVLGKLDKKTLLVATQTSFVIKEKRKTAEGEAVWTSRYYYSEIGDAIRGYVRHLLRRPGTAKHLDGNLKTLIDVVTNLENTIKKVGDKLNLDFAERLEDPIECHRIMGGDDS